MLDSMNEYDLELFECTRLFSNRIKIDSAKISPTTQRREQKSRGALRRKNIAPQVVDFGAKCSPGKEELEDESFYSSCSFFKSPPAHLCSDSDDIELLASSHGSKAPRADLSNNSLSSASASNSTAKTLSSHDSVYSSPTLDSENEIVELMGIDGADAETQLPGMDELLFSDIKTDSPERKRSARKRLDMNASMTPKSSTIASLITTPERVCLGNISNTIMPLSRPALKRPDPPAPSSPFKGAKKLRCQEEEMAIPIARAPFSQPLLHPHVKKPVFRKSVSVDEAAMHFDDKNKTADFCYELCLPILGKSKHSDLKSITPETMRRLLNGEFDSAVASYKVIDCRYPYEFEGGHIRGAQNLYMENQIYDEFMRLSRDTPHIGADGKRNIIIFHCEFSSERGPRQYRHLRSIDRAAHTYPALQYPEIYLLEGGYKAFFEENKDLCEPQAYRLMVDPEFNAQYQDYRAKAKRSGNLVGETGSKMRLKSRSRLAL